MFPVGVNKMKNTLENEYDSFLQMHKYLTKAVADFHIWTLSVTNPCF